MTLYSATCKRADIKYCLTNYECVFIINKTLYDTLVSMNCKNISYKRGYIYDHIPDDVKMKHKHLISNEINDVYLLHLNISQKIKDLFWLYCAKYAGEISIEFDDNAVLQNFILAYV